MTPDFRVFANGDDVSAQLRDRLLSLSITDHDGEEADKLEITLDDRDARLESPPVEAVLRIQLGWKGRALVDMGLFEVVGVRGDGPPDRMTITATAVDLKAMARAPRTTAHEGKSLADIANEIAGRAGLELVIGDSLKTVHFSYLAQTAESDLHFLTRIARGLDATAKAVAGKLVIARRSDRVTAAGNTKTPVRLARHRLVRWSFDMSEREKQQAIEAEVQLTGTAERKLVTAGEGALTRRLRHVFATEAEARTHADAALTRAARARITVEAGLAQFEPALFAGGLVTFDGLRPEFEGQWHLTEVRHSFGTGLTTEIKANKGEDA